MSVIVVDASVVAKWFFNEELSKTARRVLHGGYDLHAPDFMFMEVDKLLMRKIRRGDTDKELADKIRATLGSYAIQVHSFRQFRELAWGIANETGTAVYDCLYIALSRLLDCPVLTSDARFVKAIRKSDYREHVRLLDELL